MSRGDDKMIILLDNDRCRDSFARGEISKQGGIEKHGNKKIGKGKQSINKSEQKGGAI
jgi:hypothetical protein